MTLSLTSAARWLRRLTQRLPSLTGWLPTTAPVLVPIPIRIERHAPGTVGPQRHRRG